MTRAVFEGSSRDVCTGLWESKIALIEHLRTLEGAPASCNEPYVKARVAKNPENGGMVNSCEQTIWEIAELAAIDNGKWLRKDNIPTALAKIATPAVGQMFLNHKIDRGVKADRARLGVPASR